MGIATDYSRAALKGSFSWVESARNGPRISGQFPRSLAEFEVQFDTEQTCRDYLFRLRWPGGFRCPRCGGAPFWPVRSVLMQCQACGHQTSVTAGTIFQDTRKPLVDWFRAMYWLASQKNGASELGLQRVWAWAATRRPGPVCTSSDERWRGRVVTG